MRGAGANFGVATEFVFTLEEVAPKMYAGDVVMFGKGTGPEPAVEAEQTRCEIVSNFFDYFIRTAPEECSAFLILRPQGPVVQRLVHVPKDPTMPVSQVLSCPKLGFFGSILDF